MDVIISIGIGLAGLMIGFITYRLQSRQVLKRLHYTANGIRYILWENSDVEVRVQDRPLIYPNLYLLRLQNTGDAPITPTDFAAPLRLHFGKPAQIICGFINSNRPDLLGAPERIQGHGGDIFIDPFLINPRDRIDIMVVVDGVPTEPSVQARIAGVEEVAFLPPLDQGHQMKVDIHSLLFKLRADWPQPGVLDPMIIVIPSLVDPAKDLHKSFDIRVHGKSIPNAHMSMVYIHSSTGGPVHKEDVEKPLILKWPETLIGDVSGKINGIELDTFKLSRFVTWDEHQVTIYPAPLKPDQDLFVNIITSGPGDDLRVAQLPRLIADVKIGRFILEDFIEDNLRKVEPRILLSNHRAHTLWQRWQPRAQRKIRAAVRRVKEIAKSSWQN